MLRAFHWPLLWIAVWIVMILGVIVLSLMPGPPIPDLLTIAKFDHFIAYSALTAFAVQLYASRDAQFVAAVAMVVLGIALELAQGYLTTYRDMSLFDACVDTVGVAAGLAIAWTPLANLLQKMEMRIAR
ncbi:MAG TPA: VanZ family protein [Xanthomonadaceae bacterium]|jgi:VanZ family protein|nr:VanZ family protein [Xanthomonadaceae bacterium]